MEILFEETNKGIVRSYMKVVLDKLREENRYESVDTAQLDVLESSYILMLEANDTLRAEGLFTSSAKGELKAHPAVKIANEAKQQINRVLEHLNLTNKLRYKDQKTEKTLSPLDQFLASESL